MGGTWMHWGQPHVWTELSRYNLVDQLEDSAETLPGVNFKISYFFEHGRNDLSAEDDVRTTLPSKLPCLSSLVSLTLLVNFRRKT